MPRSLKQHVESFLDRDGALAVWAGAGIGAGAGLPLGDQLTDAVLEEIMGLDWPSVPSALDWLAWVYRRFYPGGDRRCPRLEFVLECLDRVSTESGMPVLPQIMRMFGDAEPAGAHAALAQWTRRGCRIITPNFDTLIEQAGGSVAPGLHYHGTHDSGYAGNTIRRLSRGLIPEIAAELDTALREARCVLFIGYSGSDWFDVVPFFCERPGRYREAIWIDHSGGECPVERQGAPLPERLHPFRDAFRRFRFVRGDTSLILDTCGADVAAFRWRPRLHSALSVLSGPVRLLAALAVLQAMGIPRLTIPLLSHLAEPGTTGLEYPPSLRRGFLRLAAETAYGAGLYRMMKGFLRQLDDCGEARDTHFIRRLQASAALFGYDLPGILRTTRQARGLSTGIEVLEQRFDCCAPPDSEELCGILEALWDFHEELHTHRRLLDMVPAGTPGRPVTALLNLIGGDAFRDYTGLRIRLLELYERAVALAGSQQNLHDEKLYKALMYEVGNDRRPPSGSLRQRYVETDDLGMLLTGGRTALMHSLKTEPGLYAAPQIRQEIGNGIAQARALGADYEAICWLAMEKCLYARLKMPWRRRGLLRELMAGIEFGPFGGTALWWAGRYRAARRMGF
jgi:hypothetical protein